MKHSAGGAREKAGVRASYPKRREPQRVHASTTSQITPPPLEGREGTFFCAFSVRHKASPTGLSLGSISHARASLDGDQGLVRFGCSDDAVSVTEASCPFRSLLLSGNVVLFPFYLLTTYLGLFKTTQSILSPSFSLTAF